MDSDTTNSTNTIEGYDKSVFVSFLNYLYKNVLSYCMSEMSHSIMPVMISIPYLELYLDSCVMKM